MRAKWMLVVFGPALVMLVGSVLVMLFVPHPVPRTATGGQRLYLTYCATCHGVTGAGNGRVASRFVGVPSLLTDRARGYTDGYLYSIIRYGLRERVVGVRAVDASVKDFIDAFADKKAYDSLYPKWESECRVLLDAGADVIVPAGGLPMMLFGGSEMEGAPVVNGVTLIAKSAELAIKLRRLGMAKVSRRSNYATPPEKALREFLDQG